MIILNDLHLGAVRKGGTTPATQAAIRGYLQSSLRGFLSASVDNHVVINGDLFDNFSVEPSEVVLAYETLADWLYATHSHNLTLIQGNHDWNPRGEKLSSFHLLCHFIVSRFGSQVTVIDKGFAEVSDGVWAVPHMPNQDLFDMEIDDLLDKDFGDPVGALVKRYLLLHANYCSTFAEHADHSLNVSAEQVKALADAGWHLIFGHEHQHRELPHATIVGNQWPSSIADCLSHGSAQKDGTKCALRIAADGTLIKLPTWSAMNDYVEMDWRELDTEATQRFIRVTGDASAAEAEAAMSAIARFRQKSPALVVGNAVKVEGVSVIEGFEGSIQESIKSFDVLSALLEELTPPEAVVVKGLMA